MIAGRSGFQAATQSLVDSRVVAAGLNPTGGAIEWARTSTSCAMSSDRPLAGNQLAVFPDAGEIPEARLQPLAREINFSETVFAYPAAGDGHARIRIFTPQSELPFAGHPVLGSAFVLGAALGGDEIRLETGRGVIPVRLQRD